MYMTKKTIRQWRRGIGIPAVALILCVALFVGCSRDDGLEPDGGDPVALSFTATVGGVAFVQGGTSAGLRSTSDVLTRTTGDGDEWVQDDKIGIFMLDAGRNLPGITGAENRKFKVSNITTGALTLDDGGTEIYYPQSGNVDFIAYYPYASATGTGSGEITTDYKYNISVADQSQPEKIDVLYAQKMNVAKSKTVPVNLEFSHVMSKITLNVKAGDGITAGNISGLAATAVVFNGMPVTAKLVLQDGTFTLGTDLAQTFSPLKAGTPTDTYDATFSAIIIPQPTGGTDRTLVFTVGGQEFTWTIPDVDVFAAGNHYTYSVTVKKTSIEVGNSTITDWNENDNGTGTAEVLAVRIKAGTFFMGSSDGNNYPTGAPGVDLNA